MSDIPFTRVTPGDLAWHVDGLDPRPVVYAETDYRKDRAMIVIDVLGKHIVVPAANYTFTRRPEPECVVCGITEREHGKTVDPIGVHPFRAEMTPAEAAEAAL